MNNFSFLIIGWFGACYRKRKNKEVCSELGPCGCFSPRAVVFGAYRKVKGKNVNTRVFT